MILFILLLPIAVVYLILLALPIWLFTGRYPLDPFNDFADDIILKVK
jgi:hypothetical protein